MKPTKNLTRHEALAAWRAFYEAATGSASARRDVADAGLAGLEEVAAAYREPAPETTGGQ